MAEDQRANRNVGKEGVAYIEPHGRQDHSHQCHGRCCLWRWASGAVPDQIVTTNISAGGDSDSLVVTLDNIAVGLLFTGSSAAAGRSGGTNLIRRRIREGWTYGTAASTRWNRGW